ncbi:MAG: type II toxin-antitoxin system antitoxin SocA domain-containing protein [Candidatus Scalindua sp.]
MIIKEEIVSPFSDSNAVLKRKKGINTFRKEEFEITEHYYQCIETDEKFTTDEIDQINLNQVYNQYRDKFGLPFPDQIRKIREQYEISASKMSEILGLGTNSYRLYEQGEVPSVGNGRLILAADDPKELKRFLRTSQEVIGEKDFLKLTAKVDSMIEEADKNKFGIFLIGRLFDVIVPDQFTGYRIPNFEKISHMVLFFSERTQTWKTKLNKLLFYSDFLAFKNSGYGISGLDYRAIQMGPVPAKFEDMYNEMNYGGIVEREYYEIEDGIYGSLFKSKVTFNESIFEDFEIEIMEKVSDKLKDLNIREVINYSHREIAWKANREDKKIISYKDYGFKLLEM